MELTASAEHSWSEVHVQIAPDLLPEALRRAGRLPPTSDYEWQIRGWWRRAGHFVLTLAALHVTE
jgi:hypothetical protein